MLINLILICLALLGVFYGFRRAWIAPLPGVRLEMAYPIREEGDFGPESAYQLLLLAIAEPEETPPPEAAEPIWPNGFWTEALTRLKTQPWPQPAPGADSPWTTAQVADLERVLAFYRPRFAILDRALAAPDPQMPTMRTAGGPFLRYFSPAMRLGQALVLSAHCRAAGGDVAGAYGDLARAARFGNLITRGVPVVNALLGRALLLDSCEAAWLFACRYGGPGDVLRHAASDYLACADALEPVVEIMRAEGQFALNSVPSTPDAFLAQFDSDLVLDPTAWQPSRTTLRLLARFGWLVGSTQSRIARDTRALLQHLVAAAEQPYSVAVAADLEALAQRLAARRSAIGVLLRTWDPVGYLMSCNSVGTWQSSLGSLVTLRAQVRATALFLAVKAYERKHGAPPERLEQLVPDYLPHVPADPFDGQPLRYLRRGVPGLLAETWAIYSIGRDFADDGGIGHRLGADRRYDDPGPDLVWPSCPYPAP